MRATWDECRSGREKEGTRLVLNRELPDKMETRNSCIWKGSMEIGQRYCQRWKSAVTKSVERQSTNCREESRRDQEQVAMCYMECALLRNRGQTWVAPHLSPRKTLYNPLFLSTQLLTRQQWLSCFCQPCSVTKGQGKVSSDAKGLNVMTHTTWRYDVIF